MVIAFCFNICIGHQEYGKNDGDDVPTGENETTGDSLLVLRSAPLDE